MQVDERWVGQIRQQSIRPTKGLIQQVLVEVIDIRLRCHQPLFLQPVFGGSFGHGETEGCDDIGASHHARLQLGVADRAAREWQSA